MCTRIAGGMKALAALHSGFVDSLCGPTLPASERLRRRDARVGRQKLLAIGKSGLSSGDDSAVSRVEALERRAGRAQVEHVVPPQRPQPRYHALCREAGDQRKGVALTRQGCSRRSTRP